MKKQKIYILFLAVSLLFHSCEGAFDYDFDLKIDESIDASPEIAIPLVYGSVAISDLLPDSEDTGTFLEIDDQNLIHLKFSSRLGGYAATEYFGDNPLFGATLPEIVYKIPPQRMDLGFSQYALDGEFELGSPEIIFTISNEWNIGVQFMFSDFYYYDADDNPTAVTGTFVDELVTIAVPDAAGDPGITEISITNDNSSISDLISAFPDFVSFSGEVRTIAGSAYSVNEGDSVTLDMAMDIPMDLRTSDLSITDTIDFEESAEDLDQVETASLRLLIDNGFPIAIKAQLSMMDENNVILGKLYNGAEYFEVTSAATDANGVVQSSTSSELVFEVDQATLENLKKTKFLLFTVILNTDKEDEGRTVKIYTDYSISIDVSAKAKFNISN